MPVRSDQSTADALAATRALARVADELGFRRYWLAEHHNMPAVAATNPPVLVAMVAAVTERIRVGSGGVMLPNHAPLVVAEQFALLEAAHPGRIDLGIGRAPGTDPVTAWALRHGGGGVEDDAVARFPEYVEQHHGDALARRRRACAWPAGPTCSGRRRTRRLRRMSGCWDRPTTRPGSPPRRGCPTSSRTTSPAGAPPRRSRSTASLFQPSADHPEPRTFLTVNAVVAPTQQEADRLALPNLRSMVALRTGQPLRAQQLVEEVEENDLDLARGDLARQMLDRWVVGTPESAAAQLRRLATTFDVDEVMVHPVAGALRGTPADRSPAREETLRLLGAALV